VIDRRCVEQEKGEVLEIESLVPRAPPMRLVGSEDRHVGMEMAFAAS
jgi:hypothetical protein